MQPAAPILWRSLQFAPDDDPEELGEMVRAVQRIPSPFQGYDNSWS